MRASRRSLVKVVGGKFYWRNQIIPHFPPLLGELVSPFFGGAHIEVEMAAEGCRVWGGELYKPNAALWDVILHRPEVLADCVERWGKVPQSKERHRETLDRFEADYARRGEVGDDHLACAYYLALQCSYNGIPGQSGTCPTHVTSSRDGRPRLKFDTERAAAKIRRWRSPGIVDVAWQDYGETLRQHPHTFAYLDPPYCLGREGSVLYGDGLHEAFDHGRLRETLAGHHGGFLLSYNDCAEVRALYGGWCRLEEIEGSYRVGGKTERKTELLIKGPRRKGSRFEQWW